MRLKKFFGGWVRKLLGLYGILNLFCHRECFELFNEACTKALQCGAELCIDESLQASRGQGFSFKQYMPLKPAKYGLLYRYSESVFPDEHWLCPSSCESVSVYFLYFLYIFIYSMVHHSVNGWSQRVVRSMKRLLSFELKRYLEKKWVNFQAFYICPNFVYRVLSDALRAYTYVSFIYAGKPSEEPYKHYIQGNTYFVIVLLFLMFCCETFSAKM